MVRDRYLRVISINIHHGRDRFEREQTAEQGRIISTFDFALVQETERDTERNKSRDLLKELADTSGLEYLSYALWHPYKGGEYGVGILSRFPIIEEKTLLLPKVAQGITRDIDDKARKVSEQRGVQIARVAYPGQEFMLVNTHSSLWSSERMVSDIVLGTILEMSKGPVILGGDLNIENPEEYPNLKKFHELTPGNFPTYPVPQPSKAIDKLFGKGITPLNSYVITSEVSDHYAVGLDFKFQR